MNYIPELIYIYNLVESKYISGSTSTFESVLNLNLVFMLQYDLGRISPEMNYRLVGYNKWFGWFYVPAAGTRSIRTEKKGFYI